MTKKEKKIDIISRMMALLDTNSLDILFEESFEGMTNNKEIYEADFYASINMRVSELYQLKNELELQKQMLEE